MAASSSSMDITPILKQRLADIFRVFCEVVQNSVPSELAPTSSRSTLIINEWTARFNPQKSPATDKEVLELARVFVTACQKSHVDLTGNELLFCLYDMAVRMGVSSETEFRKIKNFSESLITEITKRPPEFLNRLSLSSLKALFENINPSQNPELVLKLRAYLVAGHLKELEEQLDELCSSNQEQMLLSAYVFQATQNLASPEGKRFITLQVFSQMVHVLRQFIKKVKDESSFVLDKKNTEIAVKILTLRHLLLRNFFSYFDHPSLLINNLLKKLAIAVAYTTEEAVCDLLIPHIEDLRSGYEFQDVKDEVEPDGPESFNFYDYVLCDNVMLSILPLFDLSKANPTLLFESSDLLETPEQHAALRRSVPPVSESYYDALNNYHHEKKQGGTFGFALKQLTDRLAKASVRNRKNNRATETLPDIEILGTVISDFYAIWIQLPEDTKRQIAEYKSSSRMYRLESYLLALFYGARCEISAEERARVEAEDILACLDIISAGLDAILLAHPDLYQISIDGSTMILIPDFDSLHRKLKETLPHRIGQQVFGEETFITCYIFLGLLPCLLQQTSPSAEDWLEAFPTFDHFKYAYQNNLAAFFGQDFLQILPGKLAEQVQTSQHVIQLLGDTPKCRQLELMCQLVSRLNEGNILKDYAGFQELLLVLLKNDTLSPEGLINLFENLLSKFIKTESNLTDILKIFPDTSWPMLMKIFSKEPGLHKIIENSEMFVRILQSFTPRQRLILLECGRELIQDAKYLGQVLGTLPDDFLEAFPSEATLTLTRCCNLPLIAASIKTLDDACQILKNFPESLRSPLLQEITFSRIRVMFAESPYQNEIWKYLPADFIEEYGFVSIGIRVETWGNFLNLIKNFSPALQPTLIEKMHESKLDLVTQGRGRLQVVIPLLSNKSRHILIGRISQSKLENLFDSSADLNKVMPLLDEESCHILMRRFSPEYIFSRSFTHPREFLFLLKNCPKSLKDDFFSMFDLDLLKSIIERIDGKHHSTHNYAFMLEELSLETRLKYFNSFLEEITANIKNTWELVSILEVFPMEIRPEILMSLVNVLSKVTNGLESYTKLGRIVFALPVRLTRKDKEHGWISPVDFPLVALLGHIRQYLYFNEQGLSIWQEIMESCPSLETDLENFPAETLAKVLTTSHIKPPRLSTRFFTSSKRSKDIAEEMKRHFEIHPNLSLQACLEHINSRKYALPLSVYDNNFIDSTNLTQGAINPLTLLGGVVRVASRKIQFILDRQERTFVASTSATPTCSSSLDQTPSSSTSNPSSSKSFFPFPLTCYPALDEPDVSNTATRPTRKSGLYRTG
jgi:hypothetical protein